VPNCRGGTADLIVLNGKVVPSMRARRSPGRRHSWGRIVAVGTLRRS
jgi:hypothetical protein